MRASLVFLPVIVLLPCRVPAQVSTADSLPFRRGQWAAQFAATADHRNIGLMRFRSRTAAWLIDGSVAAGSTDEDVSGQRDTSVFRRSASRTSGGLRARLGHRWYRTLVKSAASFSSFGFVVGGNRIRDTDSPADTRYTRRITSWQTGLFGEVGAAYLVIPHASLGVIASLEGVYTSDRTTVSGGGAKDVGRRQSFSLGSSVLSVIATVYF